MPRHSMYAIYAYIGVVWGVNGAAYMAVPWSGWDGYHLHVPGVTKGWCLVPSSEWMFWAPLTSKFGTPL